MSGTVETGDHPIPFRTRKLSPSSPKVLAEQVRGRIGRSAAWAAPFSFAQRGPRPGGPGRGPLLLPWQSRGRTPRSGGKRRTACFLRSRKMTPSRSPLFRARGEDARVGSYEAQSLHFLFRYPTAGFNHSRSSCGHCRAFTVETLLRSHSVSFREVQ